MGRFGLPDDWNDRHDRFIARAEALDIERETIVKLVKERYPILRYTVITLDMLDRRIQALDQSGNDYFRAGSIQRCAELKAKFKAKRREKEQAEERELMAKHKAYKDAQKKEDEEEAGQETEQVRAGVTD
ncbi:MAG: hypothetical protein M1830_002828 [Pleopsidium flavum]|nr:MAG: hypothetical protein M1830_002828 [Pleopsidium flavum]